MRRIFIIILFGVIAFVVIKVSTSGWKFSKKSFSGHGKNPELVEILKSHVYKLAHVIGDRSVYKPDKLNEAADYITEQFSSYGYDVEFQTYTLMGQTTRNIIACKKGKPDEVVIVGAHYDTCFNPGANDNASAVAGLLELARLMSDKETDCAIKFIAFVNEEPPFFKTENM
ncbi:MAG: M28 family peptidase, partial [Candidatus Aureabacteria bacterium]|nr:M28 family peptidase [Candidatus Auribacterota bacterium]